MTVLLRDDARRSGAARVHAIAQVVQAVLDLAEW